MKPALLSYSTVMLVVFAQTGGMARSEGGIAKSSAMTNECPHSVIAVVPPAQGDATTGEYQVISSNNRDAHVMFDGSMSWDPEGDPLSYAWYHTSSSQDAKDGKKSKKKSKKSRPDRCDPVTELTMMYLGEAEAAVGVAQRGRAVLFFAVLQPGDQFTFHGAGKNGEMSPEIAVFVDGVMNAVFDTSGKTILPTGAMDGAFQVLSGQTTGSDELCSVSSTPPGSTPCPPERVAELTLEYTGSASPVAVGVAQKGKAVLFFSVLEPGDQFTFHGAGKDGDMRPEIAVFVDGQVNAIFNTDGKTALSAGQTSGDFTVVSGLTVDGGPLCDSAEGGTPFGMDVVAERVLPIGVHTVELEVSDGSCTNRSSAVIEVISAGTAIEQCAVLVANTPMEHNHRRILIKVLAGAVKEFNHAEVERGISCLNLFVAIVEAIPSMTDADKMILTDCASGILDAL